MKFKVSFVMNIYIFRRGEGREGIKFLSLKKEEIEEEILIFDIIWMNIVLEEIS